MMGHARRALTHDRPRLFDGRVACSHNLAIGDGGLELLEPFVLRRRATPHHGAAVVSRIVLQLFLFDSLCKTRRQLRLRRQHSKHDTYTNRRTAHS